MKIIVKNSLLVVLLLCSANLMAQTSQSFSWTVTATGTETWYTATTNYTSVTASIRGYHPNPPWDIETITAGVSGLGTYYAHLDPPTDFGFWVTTSLSVGSITIFNNTVGNANDPETINLTFNASANTMYTIEAYDDDFTGASTVTVSVPQSIQQTAHTATRTASGTGNNSVSASDGQRNCYGFYCPPQPQNGGTISGITYSLKCNNPNVALVFADTWTTTTANPNAYIIAVWVPTLQGLSVSTVSLTNVVFQILPVLSTNYSVGGYYAANGVTNYFGTGPGPGWMGVGPLRPNTTYAFYSCEHDLVNNVNGPTITTNVTTLPIPALQGLSVSSVSLTNVVFQILPALPTNYSVGGYYVANRITNTFGTGPGPGWMEVGPLQPDTAYAFYCYLHDLVNNMNGTVSTTNVTTLSVPVPVVTSIVPGLTNALLTCTGNFARRHGALVDIY